MRSPLLDLPGAVGADGIDRDVAAHYGSFNGEQRTLESGEGFVDLSHRDVVRVSGDSQGRVHEADPRPHPSAGQRLSSWPLVRRQTGRPHSTSGRQPPPQPFPSA